MNRNQAVLKQFVAFCEANPELRFWQALRVFCNANFVLVAGRIKEGEPQQWVDTYYWEGINE